MEPRPSRPSRATGQSSTRTTRTPWTPSPTAEPPTSQRSADIYSAPPNQSGGQWYGQPGTYAPADQGDYRQTGPMTPIKPRGERSNKLLRYLLAAIVLIAVIGGGAYAITRYVGNDDDSPENPPVAAVTDGSVTPTLAPTQATGGDQNAPTPTTAAAAPTPTTAAADPTEAPADQNADGAAAAQGDSTTPASEDGTSGDAGTTGSSAAFLPPPSVLDGDWVVTDEGERSKAEVAEQVGANGEELLTSWRWRENFYEDLNRNDAADAPDDASFINVSVHRFANADGASEALTALSDIVVAAQGLQDVDAPAVGDAARALSGPGDGVNLYVLYVQDGKYLIRIGGSSATGDPAAAVDALAETILAGRDTSA